MSNNETTEIIKHDKTSFNNSGKPLRIGTGKPGPGRPKKADEREARNLAVTALKKKYGSLEKGMLALIESKEPALMRFVWEHAIGKVPDKILPPGGVPFNQLNIQVIAAKKDSNGNDGSSDNNSISATPGEQ